MSGRLVYMNGEFVAEKDAKISIYDSALMFGDMIFEMTRSFNKQHFMLGEHLERLFLSAKILHIDMKMNVDELERICHETTSINDPFFEDDDEHRLMINVSRGPLGMYSHLFADELRPTIVVADFPLKWTVAAMAPLYDTGINAIVPSQRAIPAHLMEPKIKNRSRLWYQMANIEVSNYEGENNWPLLLDPDGFITEGTGDNFFIVKDEKLFTPEGRNILRGISRKYIFQLGEELGIQVIEKNIEQYDVYDSDEAFMTGTPFCLLPVTSLNNIKIGSGEMGLITSKLLDRWSENTGLDIVAQIKNYGNCLGSGKQSTSTPYQFMR